MAGGVGIGPGLAPAGHPPIDQLGTALQRHLRPQTQALHDPGAEALEDRVSAFHELQTSFDGRGVLEVQGHGAPAAGGDIGGTSAPLSLAVDAHHIRAQVRQQHAAERSRPDARELHDLQPCQRSLAHMSHSLDFPTV